MNNKKIQYINLLLPTILCFVLLFDAYVLVPEKDNIKNDQQFLAVKVKNGIVHVYWKNRK